MIFDPTWKRWLSILSGSQKKSTLSTKRASNRARLQVEQLEDRWVPSGVPTVDLTHAGAIGQINGAIFRQADVQPAGTGVIDSFVRLKAPGNSTIEQGYNTDYRPLQFDENNSPQFTRSLLLSSVPTVTIGGASYREFLLDINQKSSDPLLSLDELRFYTSSVGNLHNYDTTTNTLPGATQRYDMGGSNGAGNWVELNARLSHGSGQSDMLLYVPAADFTGGSYVYLYSKFGVNVGCNGGFEEWAVGAGAKAVTNDNTGSISGFVQNDANIHMPPMPVTVTLTLNTQSGPVTFTTTTAADGSYTFSNLISGTYSLSAGQASGFNYHSATPGTGMDTPPASNNGTASDNHTISSIVLDSDDAGINYDFSEVPAQSYSIGGFVTDNGSPNTSYTVTLTDTMTHATQTFTASKSSSYSFTGLTAGHNYTVTAASTGNIATPPSPPGYSNPDLMSNVTTDDFLISPRP